MAAKRRFAVSVERPESVHVMIVGQKNNVILIEEYDLGAENWL